MEARARLHSATVSILLLSATDTQLANIFFCAGAATWNFLPPHVTDMSVSLTVHCVQLQKTVEDISVSLTHIHDT